MTDFEISYLLVDQGELLQASFMNLFSIVTSFLLVAYFISAKLPKRTSWFVVALFVLVYMMMSFQLVRVVQVFIAVLAQFKGHPALAWHPAYSSPDAFSEMMIIALGLLLVFVLAGSLFFYARSRTAGVTP